MRASSFNVASLAAAISLVAAAPSPVNLERSSSPYAPVKAACPAGSLVREGCDGISPSEKAYVDGRKPIADAALRSFLSKTNRGFGVPYNYPTLAYTSSGGGLRALLETAGVHQTFDDRDSTSSVAGIYQALTYESGLSGGAWFLGSLTGNNWPTISSLKTMLWETSFMNGLAVPDGAFVATADADIAGDILAKDAAGFPSTLTDPYGRLLGYLLLEQAFGGVADTLSGLTSQTSFATRSVPFPIITSIGVDTSKGQCIPPANGVQYELSPYEFGSWDSGIDAFTETKYLGSSLNNGKPATPGVCETRFDNLGFVMGTSSNLFNELCGSGDSLPGALGIFAKDLEELLGQVHQFSTRDEYADYPNPFYNLSSSPAVSSMQQLSLVDGGESDQNNPIWPFLHRAVDVMIVNDNSADTATNFPNGSEIYETYVQAKAAGLSRMPVIPPVSIFTSKGLDMKPTFFGCFSKETATIVYLPNTAYSYNSGQSTFKLQYSKNETDAMISNGNLIGNYNNNKDWATCLGCGIMKKSGANLPSACKACFGQFCYN